MTNTAFISKEERKVKKIQVDDFMTIHKYYDSSDNPDVDMVIGELNGIHSNRVNNKSTKLYYLEKGSVSVKMDGVSLNFDQGDSFMVKPGQWVEMIGREAKLVIISSPAFDPADEQIS